MITLLLFYKRRKFTIIKRKQSEKTASMDTPLTLRPGNSLPNSQDTPVGQQSGGQMFSCGGPSYAAIANLVVIDAFSARDNATYCIVTPWECRIAIVMETM